MIKRSTCLAVLRDEDGYLHFAGDRLISRNFGKAQSRPYPKVGYRNGVLLSGTGDAYLCDVFVHHWPIPVKRPGQDSFAYIHGVFMPHLMDFLNSDGDTMPDRRALFGSDYGGGAAFLVGVGSDLYELDLTADAIMINGIDAPAAHGCRGPLAMGSLMTTEGSTMSVEDRLTVALTVAAGVSPGCHSTIDIISNAPPIIKAPAVIKKKKSTTKKRRTKKNGE